MHNHCRRACQWNVPTTDLFSVNFNKILFQNGIFKFEFTNFFITFDFRFSPSETCLLTSLRMHSFSPPFLSFLFSTDHLWSEQSKIILMFHVCSIKSRNNVTSPNFNPNILTLNSKADFSNNENDSVCFIHLNRCTARMRHFYMVLLPFFKRQLCILFSTCFFCLFIIFLLWYAFLHRSIQWY